MTTLIGLRRRRHVVAAAALLSVVWACSTVDSEVTGSSEAGADDASAQEASTDASASSGEDTGTSPALDSSSPHDAADAADARDAGDAADAADAPDVAANSMQLSGTWTAHGGDGGCSAPGDVVIADVASPSSVALAGDYVFWVDGFAMYRAPRDGSSAPERIHAWSSGADLLAIGTSVFFSAALAPDASVGGSYKGNLVRLDATTGYASMMNTPTLVQLQFPHGATAFSEGLAYYYCNVQCTNLYGCLADKVARVPLDGAAATMPVPGRCPGPAVGGYTYWSTSGVNDAGTYVGVARACSDGSCADESFLYFTGISSYTGAFTVTSTDVYIVADTKIVRMPLSSAPAADWASFSDLAGVLPADVFAIGNRLFVQNDSSLAWSPIGASPSFHQEPGLFYKRPVIDGHDMAFFQPGAPTHDAASIVNPPASKLVVRCLP